ncbi:MAG: hypothetical protein R3F29_06810 [Planctomycetota bacterium]
MTRSLVRSFPRASLLAALLCSSVATGQEPSPDQGVGLDGDAYRSRLEQEAKRGEWLVPLHTAEADGGVDYGVWAAAGRYKASFHDGATLVPLLGPDQPHNLPVRWRTDSVRAGEHELVTRAPLLSWSGRHAQYDLGGVVEAYEVRTDGLEQTFVLATRPAATGDLVVRGTLTTELLVETASAAHRALQLRDAAGGVIAVYGAATAIDAGGRRWPMTTACENGEVTLRLDAASLAAAEFPLLVDPLLGPGQAANGAWSQDIDVARETDLSNNNTTVVAWSVVASASDSDVYVQRWRDDGTLGPQVYVDITSSWSTSEPRAAYSRLADQSVVTFDRFFPGSQQRLLRYHRHARTDQTSNTSFGTIAASDNAWRTDVSGVLNFSSYPPEALVVWQQEPNGGGAFQETSSSDIYGCYLDLTAGVAGTPFVIAATALVDHERPRLSATGVSGQNGWGVVYQAYSTLVPNDDWDVAMRLIDLQGGVTAAMAIDDASPDHKLAPVIGGFSPHFLVAWTSSTVAQQPGKPTGVNGHQLRVAPVIWSYVDPVGTQPHGTTVLQSNTDARLELAGLAWDRDTDSHWVLMFRSNVTQVLYARGVGFTGHELWAETVHDPAGSNTSVRGAVAFWRENGSSEFVLAYGENTAGGGGLGYVTIDRFVYPTIAPWVATGLGCSGAVIQWSGSQLIGSRMSRVQVNGGPLTSLHVLAMATAPASGLLVGIPPFVDGCWLLVPNVGPDYLGLVGVGFGYGAQWNFALPEWLVDDTFYFQDFHTDDSGQFQLVSTQRLEVPIGK